MSEIKIDAGFDMFYRTVSLYIWKRDAPKKRYRGEIQWIPLTDEYQQYPPSLRLEQEQVQALMDRLWDCGVRPTEVAGSAGSLAATKYHLEDMRKLVFEKGINHE